MQEIKVNLVLGGDLLERYNRYAQLTDQTIKGALKEALQDWMDTIGEGTIEVITGVPMDSEAVRLGLPVVPCALPAVAVH
jgi:hypothetical protein